MKRLPGILGAVLVLAAVATGLFNNRSAAGLFSRGTASREEVKSGTEGQKKAKIKEFKTYMKGIHIPIGEEKSPAPSGYLMQEYRKVKAAKGKFAAADKNMEWIERGPSNGGGRMRALIVDPDDPTHMTWFAGSASGGVWKTTDGGYNWVCLTNDLPIQTTTTLAMAKSNTNVIYMGTGETSTYMTGGCLFRSTDKGQTWDPLESTIDDENFRFINRIEVDPDNDSIVVVATNEGIFKSRDAGQTFETKYISPFPVEDLVADTSDFNYLYAGVNSYGVVRSTDAGETWEYASEGMAEKIRIELAISPADPSRIFASVETNSTVGALYCSFDRGDSWYLVQNSVEDNYNFLGQGFYDNTIAGHPYDENIVFFGGVNLWKAEIGTQVISDEGAVSRFDTVNTASFLAFINFTDNLFPGMNTGDREDATNLLEEDFVSVEIRFGPGMSQKAHRFFVPEGATSGVPAEDYSYQDYVDVPFEVWDVTNDRQLMCSFRDQERDGSFNLYERTGDNYGQLGREYLFINAVAYDPLKPDPGIATQGGRSYKLLYFMWPTLIEGGNWDPINLPDSKIVVDWIMLQKRISDISNVSDAYIQYGGINIREWDDFDLIGLHPDHHELVMIPLDDAAEKFWVLESNDGGVSLSKDNGVNFTQRQRNIRATQFYGVAKKPYRNEYFGGTQDNGTWQSPINRDAGLDSVWTHRLGGDGFETLWNYQDSNKLMAAWYEGPIWRSEDHGLTWTYDNSLEELPFWVKLSAVPSNNNITFTTSALGVYKSSRFGDYWQLKPVGDGYCLEGYSAYWHNVKISPANENIVWAGAAMIEEYGWKMYVSTDQGNTYSPVTAPAEQVSAFMSGFATHPAEENTAYALYSIYGEPKILRTTDLGESWEDITRVDESGVSANGFPNVGVNCLMVFPDTTDKIWAGTEIGIMESLDNGESWHYLESGLPAVQIYDMFVQDNQVVAATYGRGIWTWQFGPVPAPPVVEDIITETFNERLISLYPNPTKGLVNLDLKTQTAEGEVCVAVFALNGRRIINSTLYASGEGQSIKLDLSDQTPGMYIVHVTTGNQQYSERIILE